MTDRRQAILARAPSRWMRQIVSAIAEDFEKLRQSTAPLCHRKGIVNDADEAVFNNEMQQSFEAMHYAPGFHPARQPYSRNTTHALLFVASSYLTIPLIASSEAIEFGLRLCAFFHFTQPPVRDLRNDVEKGMFNAPGMLAFIQEYKATEQEMRRLNEDEAGQNDEEERNDDKRRKKKHRHQQRQQQQLPCVKEERQDDNDDATANNGDDEDTEDVYEAERRRRQLEERNATRQRVTARWRELQLIKQRIDADVAKIPVERLARVPMSIETAEYLLDLCKKRLISPGAIRAFASLKKHDGISLCPKVRYHDLAAWAISMTHTMTSAEAERVNAATAGHVDHEGVFVRARGRKDVRALLLDSAESRAAVDQMMVLCGKVQQEQAQLEDQAAESIGGGAAASISASFDDYKSMTQEFGLDEILQVTTVAAQFGDDDAQTQQNRNGIMDDDEEREKGEAAAQRKLQEQVDAAAAQGFDEYPDW